MPITPSEYLFSIKMYVHFVNSLIDLLSFYFFDVIIVITSSSPPNNRRYHYVPPNAIFRN